MLCNDRIKETEHSRLALSVVKGEGKVDAKSILTMYLSKKYFESRNLIINVIRIFTTENRTII